MNDGRWSTAGWLALVSASLIPPNFVLSLMSDIAYRRGGPAVPIALLAALIGGVSLVLGLIVLYRFRQLLNERFQYHGVDGLITATIVIVSVLAFFAVTGRPSMMLLGIENPVLILMFVAPVILMAAVAGVLGIIIGAKLLQLECDLGLMRPYAIVSIISGACFAIVLAAPLGMVLSIVESILLALMFFRASQQPAATPEFV